MSEDSRREQRAYELRTSIEAEVYELAYLMPLSDIEEFLEDTFAGVVDEKAREDEQAAIESAEHLDGYPDDEDE